MSKLADFSTEPVLRKKDWKHAQLWAKHNTTHILQAQNNNLYFAPTASLINNMTTNVSGTSPTQFLRDVFSML
jgi:hypothetical protein